MNKVIADLKLELARVEKERDAIKKALTILTTGNQPVKRVFSPDAIRRMRQAQQKRWAFQKLNSSKVTPIRKPGKKTA